MKPLSLAVAGVSLVVSFGLAYFFAWSDLRSRCRPLFILALDCEHLLLCNSTGVFLGLVDGRTRGGAR